MPFKPHTTCKHRGCPKTVPIGQRYCAEHIKDNRRDDNRPNFRQRGYTSNWDKFRLMYLRAHPLCSCGQAANTIHHIIPIKQNGEMYEESNLIPLCRHCHEVIEGRAK